MVHGQSIQIAISRSSVHPQGVFVSALSILVRGLKPLIQVVLSPEPAQETRSQGGAPQINGIGGSTNEYLPV